MIEVYLKMSIIVFILVLFSIWVLKRDKIYLARLREEYEQQIELGLIEEKPTDNTPFVLPIFLKHLFYTLLLLTILLNINYENILSHTYYGLTTKKVNSNFVSVNELRDPSIKEHQYIDLVAMSLPILKLSDNNEIQIDNQQLFFPISKTSIKYPKVSIQVLELLHVYKLVEENIYILEKCYRHPQYCLSKYNNKLHGKDTIFDNFQNYKKFISTREPKYYKAFKKDLYNYLDKELHIIYKELSPLYRNGVLYIKEVKTDQEVQNNKQSIEYLEYLFEQLNLISHIKPLKGIVTHIDKKVMLVNEKNYNDMNSSILKSLLILALFSMITIYSLSFLEKLKEFRRGDLY